MSAAKAKQLLLLLAVSLATSAAAMSSLFLGGGLTILSQNLLDGAHNDGTAAILVHQPSPYESALSSCKLLGELLWNPDKSSFSAALNSSLTYQAYQGLAPADQQYWIAKAHEDDGECRGISANGTASSVDCLTELPVLCTQSAPVSNNTFADNSRKWQVTQAVGNTTAGNDTASLFTGYRDLHTWKFRGVRYARQPARFGYSTTPYLEAAYDNYNGSQPVMAVEAGADCVQPIGEVKRGSSEDCLFLNIWTPHLPRMAGAAPGELKPVMLYLYGGGFTSGSGKNPNTDGTNLASRGDVVVVSANYRVGNAGFLAFDDGVHRGNYALSDMVTALQWVRRYIAYFGGDPGRVTLFGESAGAQATHILLGSPMAKGLFQRAIMQSDPQGFPRGGKFAWMQYDSVAHAANTTTRRVLDETGCLGAADPVACLGKLSGFDLVNLTTNANGAVMDGTYLTDPWLIVNATGQSSTVAVMTGTNRDESGVLINDYPANGTTFSAYFNAKIAPHFGHLDLTASSNNNSINASSSTSSALLSSFSTSETSTPARIFNTSMAIATDGEFTCLDQAKAYSGARHGAFATTYAFVFNRTYQTAGYTRDWCTPPTTASRPHGDPDAEYFKCHAGEQLVVFGNALRDGLPDRDGRDAAFLRLVVDYWAAFARDADPNPPAAYLRARGHWDTLAQVEAVGPWEPVPVGPGAEGKPAVRLLQWDGAQVPFREREHCAALGLPLDVLEK